MSRFGLRSSSDGFKVSEEKTNGEKLCKTPKVSTKKTSTSNYQNNNNNNNKRKKSHTQNDQMERNPSPSLEESRTSNSTDVSSSMSLVCSLPINRISGILKKLNLSNKNYKIANIKSKKHNESAYKDERKSKANNECNNVEHDDMDNYNDREIEIEEKKMKTNETNQNTQALVIKILCLYCDKKFTSHEMQVKHVEKFHTQQKDRRCSGRNSQLQYESKRSTSTTSSNSSATRTATSTIPSASSSSSSAVSVTFGTLSYFPGCWFCKKTKCERVCVPAKELTGLFLHLSECHADKYFGCRFCLLRFQNIGKLSKHLQTVHRNNTTSQATNGKSSKTSSRATTVAPSAPSVGVTDTTTIGERVKVSKTRQQKSQKNIPECIRTSTSSVQETAATASPTTLSPSTIIGAEEPILSRLGLTQNRLPNNRKGVRLRRDSSLPDALVKPEQTTPTSSTTIPVSSSKVRTGKTAKNTTVNNDADGVFRMPTRTEVSCVFDDDFYKEVVSNVRKNLLYHLDGKIQDSSKDEDERSAANLDFVRQPPLPHIRSTLAQSPVIIEDSEIHAATCLSATTAFPTLLTAEQYGGDMATKIRRPHTKHSWKWKWDSVKKYKLINEGGKIVKKMKQPMLGLRDLSKLDMWTQLTMRQKHEMQQFRMATRRQRVDKSNALREEKLRLNDQLNQILDMRLVPNIILEQNEQAVIKFENDEFGVSIGHQNDEDYGDLMLGQTFTDENFLSMLSLLPTTKPETTRTRLVLSGEWARPRCYMCMCCGAKFEKLKSLEEHKMFRHSHILSTHYEVVGRELLAGNLLRHLFLPMRALNRYQNKDSLLMSMCLSRHHKSEMPALPPPLIRSNTNSTAEEESSDSLPSISNSCTTHTSSIKNSTTDDCDTDTKTTIDINTVSPTHSIQSSSGSSILTPSHKSHLNKSKGLSSASSLSLALASSQATHCTKCKRKCSGLLDLYRHMLDCSGDYIWSLVKKRKYRYYCGTKKRRQCNKHSFAELRRNKPKRASPPNPVNDAEESGSNSSTKTKSPPRPRPSDAESIKKMLENLPPKRVCKKIFPTVTKAKRAQKSKLTAKHKLYNKQVLRKTRARQLAAAKLLTKTKSQLSRKVSNNNNNNNNNNSNSKKERNKKFQRKGKKIMNVVVMKKNKTESNIGSSKSVNNISSCSNSNDKIEKADKIDKVEKANSTKSSPVEKNSKVKLQQQQQLDAKELQQDSLPIESMDGKSDAKDCKDDIKQTEETQNSLNSVQSTSTTATKASSVTTTIIAIETKTESSSAPVEQKVTPVATETRSICNSLRSSVNKSDQSKSAESVLKLADSLVGGRKRSKKINDCIAMLTGKLEEKLKTEQCVTTSATNATITMTTTIASTVATTTTTIISMPTCTNTIVSKASDLNVQDNTKPSEKVKEVEIQPITPVPIEKKTPKRKAISRRIIQPLNTQSPLKSEAPVQEAPQLPPTNIHNQNPKIPPANPPATAVTPLPPSISSIVPVATTTKQPMPIPLAVPLPLPNAPCKLNQAPSPVVAMPPCPLPANAPVPALMSVPIKEVTSIPPQPNLPPASAQMPIPVPMNVSVPVSIMQMPTPIPMPANMLSKIPLFIPVQNLGPGMGPPLPGIPIALPVENIQPKVLPANVTNLNPVPAPAAPVQLNAPLPMAFIQTMPSQYNLEPLNLSNAKGSKSNTNQDKPGTHRPGIPARRQTICGWEASNFLNFDEMEPLDLSKKSKPIPTQMEPADLSPLPLVVVNPTKPVTSTANTGIMAQPQMGLPPPPDALLNKQIYSNLELLKIPQVRNPTFVSPPTEILPTVTPTKSIIAKKRGNSKTNPIESANKGLFLPTTTPTMPKGNNKETVTLKKEMVNKKQPITKMDEVVINHIDDAINSVINAASLSSSNDGDDDCNKSVSDRATNIFNPLPPPDMPLIMFPQQILPTPAPTPTTTPAPTLALAHGPPSSAAIATTKATQPIITTVPTTTPLTLPMPVIFTPATMGANEFPMLKQREVMMPQRRNMRSKTLDCRPVTLCTPLETNCFSEKLISPICSPLKQTEVPKMPTMLTIDGNKTATLSPMITQETPTILTSIEPTSPSVNVIPQSEKSQLTQQQVEKIEMDKSTIKSVDKGSSKGIGKTTVHCKTTMDLDVAVDTEISPVIIPETPKSSKSSVPIDAETEIENNNTSNAIHKIVTPTPSISHETNINSISEENMSNINNTSSGFHSSNQADSSVVGADPKKKQRRRRKNELAAIVADQLLESFKIDKARRDNLKKLENLAYEKSDDLLLTGMLLMSSTKRSAAINNNNNNNATNSSDKTTEKGTENAKRSKQESSRNARNKNKMVEVVVKDEKSKSMPDTQLSTQKNVAEPLASVETENDNDQENNKKPPGRRRSYRRRAKTMDNENIIKLKSSLESFSIGIEKQLSEIEARNMFNTESKSRTGAGAATVSNSTKPPPSILRPSILSASLEKPTMPNADNKQQENVTNESKAPVVLSSRDPRLNKNIHKLEKEASNSNGLSSKTRLNTAEENNLDEIGDLEEDNYLTEIAKNVNEKIMAAENEDFAFANDGFELVNEMQDDSNSKYYRPPTSMSVRSAPNFNDDHSNFGSMCDDNTNTEVMDMDLDDELSVYTSYSQDLGRGRGRRRRRRRSILMKRRPKKRPISRDLAAETFDCTLCKKTFFTANSLTKHNMTLAHVSKVSELEYLQSKSMQSAPVSVLNETNLELLNAQNNRLNTPKPRTTRRRSRCGSLPPPRMTRRAATPSNVLQTPMPRQMDGKCSPPRIVNQSKTVEPTKKLNNSMPLQQSQELQQQQHHDHIHHHHHHHHPEEPQNIQPSITLNPDERLFFECCSILKGAESTMRSSTTTIGAGADVGTLIRSGSGPVSGINTETCNNGANFTKAAVEQNHLFKDPQIVTPTIHSQKTAMPIVPPVIGTERNMRSPNYSAISQFSAVTNTTTSRFKTKAAMKGYENVHVDLTIQQELESKSRTVCKLTELADIALGGDKPNSSEYNTPNSDRRSESTPKRLNTPDYASLSAADNQKNCNVHMGHDRPKTAETQSSTSSKTIMHSSIIKAVTNEPSGKIIIPERPFKNIGLEEKETIKFQKPKTTINLLNDDNNSVSTASYSDRDDFDFGSMSCDDDASIKTANEKSLIMGRIFKSANTKSKSAGKIKPVAPAEKELPMVPVKTDLNQLFDELRAEVAGGCGGSFAMSKIKDADGSIPTRETPSAIIENLHNKYASMSPMPQLPPELLLTATSEAKSARNSKASKKKSSSSSTGNKKQQKKNAAKLQSELGVNREDLHLLVDESFVPGGGIYSNVSSQGRRKPKRRCAANQQKKLVEMWSSDEYEEFLSTKDIFALIEEKEKQEQKRKRKNSGHQPLMPPAITITPTTTTNTVTTATTAPLPTISNPPIDVAPVEVQKTRTGREKKRKNNNTTTIPNNQKEETPVSSTRHKKDHQAKPLKQSKQLEQEEVPLMEVAPSKRKSNNNNTTTTTKNKKRKSQSSQSATRRKRPATEKLYYWSSSSEDEFGRVDKNEFDGETTSGTGVASAAAAALGTAPAMSTVNTADVGGNFESGEQYQQHGWIVGGSHKKLVTLLAIAKGNKKVDNCGVKKRASKKKN